MSDLQNITCSMVKQAPDEVLVKILAILTQMLSGSGDFQNDTEYLKSIPGYWEETREMAKRPLSEWLDESELDW